MKLAQTQLSTFRKPEFTASVRVAFSLCVALRSMRVWLGGLLASLLMLGGVAFAERLELRESPLLSDTLKCQATVGSKGNVFFTKSETNRTSEPLEAAASFQFIERRLPGAGRDARAFRAVRHFQTATLTTTVGNHPTQVELPQTAALIVSEGHREGIRHYSPQQKLDRDALDLLEIPGDPLVLAALLPIEGVQIEDEWKPSDWVMQMLTGIEAVETSTLTCQLTAANKISAKINFNGSIKGQRYGAETEVSVKGTLIFDRRTSHVARTQAIYTIKADVGTIYPGLDLVVTSNLSRDVTSEIGSLTEQLLESIPIEAPEEQRELRFSAPEWGITVNHAREWHLFSHIPEGTNPVAIFRLVEQGTLVCQCNIVPRLRIPRGQTIPREHYESEIQEGLGQSFKKFGENQTYQTGDGRTIHRVVAEGEQEIKGLKGSALIPMTWIYYLVGEPSGRQLSFLFAVETSLVEQLADRDRRFVDQQRFTARER